MQVHRINGALEVSSREPVQCFRIAMILELRTLRSAETRWNESPSNRTVWNRTVGNNLKVVGYRQLESTINKAFNNHAGLFSQVK